MFKAVVFAAFVALAAGQQAVQQFAQGPYYNVPLVFPQGQQYLDYYNGQYQPFPYNSQYQRPFPYNGFNLNNIFKQYPYLTLVDNQNQPLGYIYWVNSEVVLQQQQNFLSVRDFYGNLLGYFSTSLVKPGQEFQPQTLDENVISQLRLFGFVYNQSNQGNSGFIVVKNPYVFYKNENGLLRPNAFHNGGYNFQQYPYNYFGPNYNGQYQYPSQYYNGQGYQGQYVPLYPGPYYPYQPFPYGYKHFGY